MTLFNDKRNLNHLPGNDDYETPLTPSALAKANKRFRQSGVSRSVGTDPVAADARIKSTTKMRRRNTKLGQPDFGTVGEYMEFLNGIQHV
jgi:hypothetical protein